VNTGRWRSEAGGAEVSCLCSIDQALRSAAQRCWKRLAATSTDSVSPACLPVHVLEDSVCVTFRPNLPLTLAKVGAISTTGTTQPAQPTSQPLCLARRGAPVDPWSARRVLDLSEQRPPLRPLPLHFLDVEPGVTSRRAQRHETESDFSVPCNVAQGTHTKCRSETLLLCLEQDKAEEKRQPTHRSIAESSICGNSSIAKLRELSAYARITITFPKKYDECFSPVSPQTNFMSCIEHGMTSPPGSLQTVGRS
jgi:hypothetical protein